MDYFAVTLRDLLKDVEDFVVFDEKPATILVIAKSSSKDPSKIAQKIKEKIKKKTIRVCVVSYQKILNKNLFRKILLKGYSLKKNSFLHENFGLHVKTLLSYNLESLSHTQKTLFGYALKGRGKDKGVLGEVKGEVVGRNSIIFPAEFMRKVDEFFGFWKVPYSKRKIIETDVDNQQKKDKKQDLLIINKKKR